MNLLEVLKEIQLENKPNLWFRPVSWSEMALTIKNGVVYQMPMDTHSIRYMTEYVSELTEEWEIVESSVVLAEIERK